MKKSAGRSAVVSDDDDDYSDEDPLPSKSNRSSLKRKPPGSDSDEEIPSKQSKTDKGKTKTAAKQESAKNPRQKQFFRTFIEREPPRALGSKEIPQGAENCLEGLTFVITGVFESIDRDETKSLILRHGGKVTQNVSKSTSYLVAGRDCGQSKINKATEFGTKTLDEDGLFDLIRRLPGKKSKYEIAAEKELSQKGKALSKSKSQSSQSFTSSSQSQSQCLSDSQSMDFGYDDSGRALSAESSLWVDKYKPTSIKNIIGQQGDKSNAKKLLAWLQHWRENYGKKPAFGPRANDTGAGLKAALLSGPPGVGKTTTAQLVCKELGFSYIELNASDTRSKRSLQEEVAVALGSRTLDDFFGKDVKSSLKDSWKHCLIMDEVDGMAGNEDRGGVQELIQLIKKTRVPVICICNDRSHPKIRSLSNYCFDLRFQRPRVEQIKGAIMSMTFKEGLKIPPAALNDIIVAANQDVRQVIHNLSMWTIKDKTLTYEQLKTEADKARKDLRLGAFDVCRKVFVGGEETANMTLNDKIDLFFNDYSIVPLFVQENYIHVAPNAARGITKNHLNCLSKASDSIAWGDLVDGVIRGSQSWNLLPVQAVFSSVIPGDTMRGGMNQMINFPSWLGKNSTYSKNNRIIQELSHHMGLKVSASKRSLHMEYLPYMRLMLSCPLANEGTSAVETVVSRLEAYDLMREDFDSIMELTAWSTSFNPMEKVDSKVKAAFTRSYNKTARPKPYATGTMSKKGRKKMPGEGDDLEGLDELEGNAEEGAAAESEHSDEDDIMQDSMIKQKKAAKTVAKIKQLNDLEEGIQSPQTSKKLQAPKNPQTSKSSESPKKGSAASKASNINSDADKAAPYRQPAVEKRSPAKSAAAAEAKSTASSSNVKSEKKSSDRENGKSATCSSTPNAEPASKKAKTKPKVEYFDDADDFAMSDSKSPNVAEKGKTKTKDKGKQGDQGKTKPEQKPADAKTKSIASYFMTKPKT